MPRWRLSIVAAGWLTGLVGATWALLALGRFDWLGIDWSDPLGWLSRAQTETALAEVARLTGLGIIGWIGVSSALYVLSVLAGVDPRRLRWMSLGPIRKIVDALLAGSLVVGTLAPTAALAQPSPPVTAPPVPETTIASGLLLPDYVPVPAGQDVDPVVPDPPERKNPKSADPGLEATSVIVEPGDNLWELSRRHIVASGSQPTDADVATYWVRVIDENRPRLRSGDPDVIFPGEEILLPALNPES